MQMIRKDWVHTFWTLRKIESMDFTVCLLFGVILTNGGYGLQEESGLPEDPIISLQAQIDFLMQKVSDLSRTSALQKVEIDDLKKENQNLFQLLSEVKSTQTHSQKIPDNLYVYEEEKTFDGNKTTDIQSVIRKGLYIYIFNSV